MVVYEDYHNLYMILYNNKFPEYNRGREHNRLCFSRLWDGRMTYEPPI